MYTLINLAERVITDRLIDVGMGVAGRNRPTGFLMALAGVFFVLGLFLIVLGTHLWLLKVFSPELAVLGTGALCLVLAALSALIVLAVFQYGRFQLTKLRHDVKETVSELVDAAHEEIADPVRENPKTALLISALAGLYTGEKIR